MQLEEPDSPPRKKQRTTGVKRDKIAYSTTTVLRSLDGDGETATVPLMASLRSASFHTKKVLQQQLQKEKQRTTPEIIVCYKNDNVLFFLIIVITTVGKKNIRNVE